MRSLPYRGRGAGRRLTGWLAAITVLSLIIAIAFVAAGVEIVRRVSLQLSRVAVAGVIVGLGVSAMHYTGMGAIRLPGTDVAVSAPDLAARLTEDFEQDLRVSRKLELGAWQQRPLLEKSREKFWSYFGEIF